MSRLPIGHLFSRMVREEWKLFSSSIKSRGDLSHSTSRLPIASVKLEALWFLCICSGEYSSTGTTKSSFLLIFFKMLIWWRKLKLYQIWWLRKLQKNSVMKKYKSWKSLTTKTKILMLFKRVDRGHLIRKWWICSCNKMRLVVMNRTIMRIKFHWVLRKKTILKFKWPILENHKKRILRDKWFMKEEVRKRHQKNLTFCLMEEDLQDLRNLPSLYPKWVDLQKVQQKEELHPKSPIMQLLSHQVIMDLKKQWSRNQLLFVANLQIIKEFQLILPSSSALL